MSQLFVGISTRSTDPSKITPLIVCTLSSISYEIKDKKSDFLFCYSRQTYIKPVIARRSRGDPGQNSSLFEVYLDCEVTALRTLLHFVRNHSQRCRFATEGVEY